MKVWVIGGTSGIGAAVVRSLSEVYGYIVHATGEEVDVRSYTAIEYAWKKEGPFGAVVYSAGINELMWLDQIDPNKAADIYAVNVLGFMSVLRLVSNDTSCKSVVAISSDAATRPMRTSAAYCASKAALDMVVKCAARELAPQVRVNAVAPGMTADTDMTSYIDKAVPEIRGWSRERAMEYERSQIPMGRRALPDEIAQTVAMVLHGPQYLTGAIIPVNGGR